MRRKQHQEIKWPFVTWLTKFLFQLIYRRPCCDVSFFHRVQIAPVTVPSPLIAVGRRVVVPRSLSQVYPGVPSRSKSGEDFTEKASVTPVMWSMSQNATHLCVTAHTGARVCRH